MRLAVRVLTAGLAVALVALPLVLIEGSACSGAATPHALTAPAQVSASNWTTMPTTATANATQHGHRRLLRHVRVLHGGRKRVLPPSSAATTG